MGADAGEAVLVVVGSFVIFGPDTLLGPTGLLLGSFAVMLTLGVPIAVAVGIASLVTALTLNLPPLIIAQRMANGVNSTPLLAIPFFILAGQIMAEGGIARRLVDLAKVMVGPVPGGLAMVNVVDSMLMGGVSGSALPPGFWPSRVSSSSLSCICEMWVTSRATLRKPSTP